MQCVGPFIYFINETIHEQRKICSQLHPKDDSVLYIKKAENEKFINKKSFYKMS